MSIFGWYSLGCVMIPCLLIQILLIVKSQRLRGNKNRDIRKKELGLHFIQVCIFLIYIWMVLEVTGIGLLSDILRSETKLLAGGVNLIPFDSGVRGYILNIIMLMPFGFLTAFIWKECRNVWRALASGMGFSLLIEFTQLFNYRTTDIDDLAANTCGAVIGYLIWKVFHRIFGDIMQTDRLCKNEEILYVLAAMGGTFLLFNPYLLLSFYN